MKKSEKVDIENEDRLLRRVPFTDPRYIKNDGSLSSFAFTPRKEDRGALSKYRKADNLWKKHFKCSQVQALFS
jgi:hypothetical protein